MSWWRQPTCKSWLELPWTDRPEGGSFWSPAARGGVLVGASAVGTGADDWISEAGVANRGQAPVRVLADVVHPFPTNASSLRGAAAPHFPLASLKQSRS